MTVVIGDVYIDYHLDLRTVRLGGSFHACRLFGALGIPYLSAHTLPQYVQTEAETQLGKLKPLNSVCFGRVENWPGIILVGDSTESAHQGYDEILRGMKSSNVNLRALLNLIDENVPTDALLFPGDWCTPALIKELKKRGIAIHIDGQYLPAPIELLDQVEGGTVSTLFVSTSDSPLWQQMQPTKTDLATLRKNYGLSTVVLKENRGGSRALADEGDFEAPAYPCETLHSVGVGDVFNAAYLATAGQQVPNRLRFSSWVASRYAETLDYSRFVEAAQWSLANLPAVASYKGSRTSWEERPKLSIYIAGPDFPTVNTSSIDDVEAALTYHNFARVRPIQDHGLDSPNLPERERLALFEKDNEAIRSASGLIAVLPESDPGTFTELGLAKGLNIPTIMYDPYGIVNNLFASRLPDAYCRRLSDVVDALFTLVGRQA